MTSISCSSAKLVHVAAGDRRRPKDLACRVYQLFIGVGASLLLLGHSPLGATTLPDGFRELLVASGLFGPTAMEFAPDGRLFVCQKDGKLRVIKNGELLPTPFVTLSVDEFGERGLLGIAFDPDFETNQYVYVYYTTSTEPIHNRVSRFTADGDVAVPDSEVVIVDLENVTSVLHNGGAIHFGQDGKLYIAVGDNGDGSNSQTLNNRLGKMLRINKDGSIPSDNPFYDIAQGENRAIWALGLRNPFTFAVQPGTDRIFINDVGEDTWEEINDGIAGSNYGWPETEGYTDDPRFRSPIFAYQHNDGCAIVGGAFYNPATQQFPEEYVGNYFFSDLCRGWISRLVPPYDTVSGFATDRPISVVDLKVSSDGSLYYLAIDAGAVFRIEYARAPGITQHPADQTVSPGQAATFTVVASGQPPLSYQWQRDRVDIPGATSSSYTILSVTLDDNGAKFRSVVSNDFGSATSNEATLTVTTNAPPTGTITSPVIGTRYNAGDTINYAGTGTDPEDGELPASAFTWQVDFHHDDHIHPFVPPTSGQTSGFFTIPDDNFETSANVWFRIHLTVRDSVGLTHTSFRDVLPLTSTVTLETDPPAGLVVKLDGQPRTAPFSVASVVGMIRTIEAVSPQTVDGATYGFESWSDGGEQTHNVVTPAADTRYTAFYRQGG